MSDRLIACPTCGRAVDSFCSRCSAERRWQQRVYEKHEAAFGAPRPQPTSVPGPGVLRYPKRKRPREGIDKASVIGWLILAILIATLVWGIR